MPKNLNSNIYIGMEVRTSIDKYLGNIKSIGVDYLLVAQRFLYGFGPIIQERAVLINKIDKIDDTIVRLKPSQSMYWGVPEDDENEHIHILKTTVRLR